MSRKQTCDPAGHARSELIRTTLLFHLQIVQRCYLLTRMLELEPSPERSGRSRQHRYPMERATEIRSIGVEGLVVLLPARNAPRLQSGVGGSPVLHSDQCGRLAERMVSPWTRERTKHWKVLRSPRSRTLPNLIRSAHSTFIGRSGKRFRPERE